MGRVPAQTPADAQLVSDLQARVEAERAGRPFLIFRDRDDRQQLFVFAPGTTQAEVGRQPSSDLALDWDDQVSRVHARFERAHDGWLLVDDGLSRNGTFINEQRLNGRQRLNDGDTLRFGATTVTFRSPEAPAQTPAPGSDAPPAPPGDVVLSSTQRRVLVALCRPYKGRSRFPSPAADQQIADDLVLSVGAVRTHLRVLCAKLGVAALPGEATRVRLVERAFSAGLISERDL
jgi:pSer/pThr/pTyr-binding forkhead associated (FHA) protein